MILPDCSSRETVKLPPSRLALWRDKAAGHAASPFGELAPGERKSRKQPTVVGKFHGQAALQSIWLKRLRNLNIRPS